MTIRPRGFAALTPEERKRIAALGGAAVPPEKRTFSKNRQLAVESGSKGGSSVPREKRSFSTDRQLAEDAGRKGGMARGGN
jgi:uncharacterized protein